MTTEHRAPPRILSSGWGKLEVDVLGRGKDFKLWPGGGRPWDWGETGTAHSPGIQAADLEELVDHGCRTIVLGCGFFSRLKVTRGALDYLEKHRIETIIADTRRAIRTYNGCIDQGRRVGALIHSTC